MTPKPKKVKAQKESKPKREGPHHRAARLENAREFVCPECWTVTETIRKDGVTIPRHPVPEGSKARTFRGTKNCNGQGRTARFVIDDPWEFGTEPKTHISAFEFIEEGTARIDAKAQKLAEKAKRAEERANAPKKPKEAKPKAPKAPKAPKPANAKPRVRKSRAKPKAAVTDEKSVEATTPAAA